MISGRLQREIKKNIDNKKQTILFLNRRGYSTFVLCRDCGEPIKCPNCSITLTYHKYENALKCHYCGIQMPVLKQCPKCGSESISSIVDTKTYTKGFDGGCACCGYLLVGWPGVLCGLSEGDFGNFGFWNS